MKINKLKKRTLIYIFLVTALAALTHAQPLYAQLLKKGPELGQEVKGEYSRIYLKENINKKYIEENNFNDIQPNMSEDYIVWSREINGAGQIFRYHIPTESILQITHTSTNLNPKVDYAGRVVWERWVNNGWQIYLFDGLKMSQISDGETSINPNIDQNKIVYGNKMNGIWTAQQFDISNNKLTNLQTGEEYKFPVFKNGSVDYDFKSNTKPIDKVYAEESTVEEAPVIVEEITPDEEIEIPEEIKETTSSENKDTEEQKSEPNTVTLEEVEEEIDNLIALTQNDTPESSSSDQLEE